ncbi:hypothetical protein L6452_01007 [Arctium lappa]|uniref:Uncharacterized protein n=1 Tax=Arctium lappa TaxID=4217 RepID=A0ACB9FGH6_ARCLA|nr:hypothetical protein L6452_01007 [Arctium lappa]
MLSSLNASTAYYVCWFQLSTRLVSGELFCRSVKHENLIEFNNIEFSTRQEINYPNYVGLKLPKEPWP